MANLNFDFQLAKIYNLGMILRELQNHCLKLAKKFPVLTITGPRQSGKTTLAKALFPKKPYINLEEPDQRQMAREDPRGFLRPLAQGAIFDEIQRAPEIPSYLQTLVDKNSKPGQFVLTGSQQFELTQSVSQSLAGRTAVVKLLPLSLRELGTRIKPEELERVLFTGFYPRIYNKSIPPHDFYTGYFETYIERDLRQLSQIDNLMTFEKFMQLLAGRVGQLFNAHNLANEVGLSNPTIKKWLSLLEASYIAFLLPPFFKNISKRLIKTPKVYFYDVGLAAYLLGIQSADQLHSHPLRGQLFENMVVVEFLKARFNQGNRSNLYFYRDRTGNEVDLIVEKALALLPVEIKSADTPSLGFLKGIRQFTQVFGKTVERGRIVYSGVKAVHHSEADFIPWHAEKLAEGV